MEEIKKCPLILALLVSGVIFTLVGIIGKNSVYQEYDFNIMEKPFLALMMEGMSKDVAPWEVCGIGTVGSDAADRLSSADGSGQSIDGLSGADVSGEDGSEEAEMQRLEGAEPQVLDGGEAQPQVLEGAEAILAQENAKKDENAGNLSEIAGEDVFQRVTESYFDDAVFIGDSRTVGLFEYGGLEERADFYAKISLTIYDVFSEKVAKDEETGKKITVEEALSKKQYGKVYLMLGINELGTGTTESFMEEYKEVVGKIRSLQPDAIIYVQGIMRVTGEKHENDPIFNNTNINEKNDEISKLAN